MDKKCPYCGIEIQGSRATWKHRLIQHITAVHVNQCIISDDALDMLVKHVQLHVEDGIACPTAARRMQLRGMLGVLEILGIDGLAKYIDGAIERMEG